MKQIHFVNLLFLKTTRIFLWLLLWWGGSLALFMFWDEIRKIFYSFSEYLSIWYVIIFTAFIYPIYLLIKTLNLEINLMEHLDYAKKYPYLWCVDKNELFTIIYNKAGKNLSSQDSVIYPAQIDEILTEYENYLKEKRAQQYPNVVKNDTAKLQKEVEQAIDNLNHAHFPQLIKWRNANRNRLIEVILNEMVSSPNDSIGMILASYESDLEHLSPNIK